MDERLGTCHVINEVSVYDAIASGSITCVRTGVLVMPISSCLERRAQALNYASAGMTRYRECVDCETGDEIFRRLNDMKEGVCGYCGRTLVIRQKIEGIPACGFCTDSLKSAIQHGCQVDQLVVDEIKAAVVKGVSRGKKSKWSWLKEGSPQQPEKEKPAKQENDALQDSASHPVSLPVKPAITMGIDVLKTGLYESIATEIGRLVDQKNAAYGDAFTKCPQYLLLLYPNGITPDQYPDMLALVRDFDKNMRIATNKDALGENPWRDKAGYAIMMNKPKD